MNRLVTILIITIVFLTCGVFSTSAGAQNKLVKKINQKVEIVHHQQSVMGVSLTPVSGKYKVTKSQAYRIWIFKKWRNQLKNTNHVFRNPPNLSQWLCIHSGEAGWDAATGNGYYGGLQMDYSFMRSYGWHLLREKGTANYWSHWEQIWVAERARASGRGFYPWPNTARACGLI